MKSIRKKNRTSKGFWKNRSGAISLEFILVIPIVMMLLIAGFEVSRYFYVHHKMAAVAEKIVALVARKNITRTQLKAILEGASEIAFPFPFKVRGTVVVSQIRNRKRSLNPNDMVISWQEKSGSQMSRLGQPGDTPQNMPGHVTVLRKDTVLIAEVFYHHVPVISQFFNQSYDLYKVSVGVPRMGTMNTLRGERLFPRP